MLLDARDIGLPPDQFRRHCRNLARTAHTSRSYAYPYALVAWHDEPVGVDIERLTDWAPHELAGILTPLEARRIPTDIDSGTVTVLWTAKEALSKALGDARRYDPRHLESPTWWVEERNGPWRTRRLPAPVGYVASMCWRDRP